MTKENTGSEIIDLASTLASDSPEPNKDFELLFDEVITEIEVLICLQLHINCE